MPPSSNKQGFTLIEILVAMGISALLGLSVAWILIGSLRSNTIIWKQLSAQNDGRKAIQQVVDDVRRAETSSIGAYPIASASSTAFTIYANIDEDSLRERVRFWLDGINLKKGVIKPSGNPLVYNANNESVVTIATSIVNIAKGVPLFLYYDENYTGTEAALTDPLDTTAIRAVRIQFEIEENPEETPVPLHIEALVQIRNLKTN